MAFVIHGLNPALLTPPKRGRTHGARERGAFAAY